MQNLFNNNDKKYDFRKRITRSCILVIISDEESSFLTLTE